MENRPSQPRTALLLVDVQVGQVALMSAEVRDSVLLKIKTLLAEARASGIPVIYIQHDGASAGDLYRGLENLSLAPTSRRRMRNQEAGIGLVLRNHAPTGA